MRGTRLIIPLPQRPRAAANRPNVLAAAVLFINLKIASERSFSPAPLMCMFPAINFHSMAFPFADFVHRNICAGYALAQNTQNSQAHGQNYQQCKEVNAYLVKKDGVAQGTMCALYTQLFPAIFGNYQPGWQGQHFWGIESSCVISVNQQTPPSAGQKPWWQWW